MSTATERREELEAVSREASTCVRCPQLVAARTQVVFGSGNADADLMFVGEAPGRGEDEAGVPFAGPSGALLEELLAAHGLTRDEAFFVHALKCRPPGNRDPLAQEIANCQGWLHRQLELVQPKVVCALGNFATRLLRGDQAPVTRLHGRAEVRVVGPRAVRLLPLYHPAAALYTKELLEALRSDFARIPELLALPAPDQPPPPEPVAPEPEPAPEPPPEDQLGLF